MDEFQQQSTDDVDVATVDAIDLSSLTSTLRRNCARNNIPNIIAQLLHMYQPEDGIAAYERVLRKVQDLLEDCSSYKKQSLLSTIPAPKDASDYIIGEVFHTTTGFVKLNPQESKTSENTLDVKNVEGTTDNNVLSSKENFLCSKNTSSSKSSLSEGFPFRGFAENEISTTSSHVKNADSSNRPSSDNPKNWLDRNNKYQMSTYRQYLLNKKYYAPAGSGSTSESCFCYSSRAIYQDTCRMKTYDNTEIIVDLRQDKVVPRFNNVRYESKKYDDSFDKNTKPGVSRALIDVGQNATTVEQTIKDDIRKMDVCWDEDQDIFIDVLTTECRSNPLELLDWCKRESSRNALRRTSSTWKQIFVHADDLLAIVRDGLKTSLSNFLKRAREGISIELSAFPRTRSYPQMDSFNPVYFVSKNRKPATARKVLGEDFTFSLATGDNDSCLLSKRQNVDVNSGKNQMTRQIALPRVVGTQARCNAQELDKAVELPSLRNDSEYVTEKKSITVKRKENDTEELVHGYRAMGARSSDVNSENNFQAHSMSELAAYKRQYYDTLLSVQRAKVAVTNSLASSSDRLMAYEDSYYSNCAYQQQQQQQHLFQQRQCRYPARSQFSTCSTALSGLSGTQCGNSQCSWAKSDCKYLLLKQLRRQTPSVYACDQGEWIRRYVGPAYPYRPFVPNGSGQTRQCVRRKSLEDVVGKLKGLECSRSVND